MKRAKPQPPAGVPEGTKQLGGPIGWFRISLHITSDELDPADVTKCFRIEPSAAQKKGVPLLRPDGTKKRVPKFGRWTLAITPKETDEWDIEEAAWLLMRRLPNGLDTWSQLPSNTRKQLSFGVSLDSWNQEFSLTPEFARYVSERNIELYFDVYADDGSDGGEGDS